MLWTVQGLMCAVILMGGGMKVFAYERYKKIGEKSPNQNHHQHNEVRVHFLEQPVKGHHGETKTARKEHEEKRIVDRDIPILIPVSSFPGSQPFL